MKQKEILVIIPAYNEESNIAGVLEDIEKNSISKVRIFWWLMMLPRMQRAKL